MRASWFSTAQELTQAWWPVNSPIAAGLGIMWLYLWLCIVLPYWWYILAEMVGPAVRRVVWALRLSPMTLLVSVLRVLAKEAVLELIRRLSEF